METDIINGGVALDNTSMLSKRDFSLFAMKLAFPLMIQNLISTLVSTADTLMLGYVSQTAMSASSLANQYTFVLFCFYYGLAAGTSVLCAQYWGKGDKQTVERIISLATKIAVAISFGFFVVSYFFPQYIMRLFSNSPETIAEGTQYLKVISFSFAFMGFAQVFISALRSVGKVVFPSVVYIISLMINVLLNATFIFGLLGMPKLGVVGVALGTVIARAVEVVLCLVYSFKSNDFRISFKYLFKRSGVLFKDFVKISAPSVVNDLVWGLAATAFSAILGHIGDDMVAANAVAVMVVNIGAIVCRGFANATTVIISQTLGENNMEATKVYSARMLKITIAVGLLGCAVIMSIRPFMVSFYSNKLTETAIHYLGIIVAMNTWRLVGEGINTCLICGCFRGGGDARFGMILDTVFMWGVAVPLMAIAAYVFRLPPVWVYFVMTLDELLKMPVILIHYFKFNWMRNITRDQEELEA